MKKDSLIRTGFTPAQGAQARVWEKLQQTIHSPVRELKFRWSLATFLVLLMAVALGIYIHSPQKNPQLAKAQSIFQLGNAATPRGLEFLPDYVPFE